MVSDHGMTKPEGRGAEENPHQRRPHTGEVGDEHEPEYRRGTNQRRPKGMNKAPHRYIAEGDGGGDQGSNALGT